RYFHVPGVQTCALPISTPRAYIMLSDMSLLIRFVFIFLTCMPFIAAAQAAENEIVLSWWSAVYPPDEQLRGDFLERANTLTDLRSEEHTSELQSRENLV